MNLAEHQRAKKSEHNIKNHIEHEPLVILFDWRFYPKSH